MNIRKASRSTWYSLAFALLGSLNVVAVARAQSDQIGAPLDLNSIRAESYHINLSGRFGGTVAPGMGVNMSTPYWPLPVPYPPFLKSKTNNGLAKIVDARVRRPFTNSSLNAPASSPTIKLNSFGKDNSPVPPPPENQWTVSSVYQDNLSIEEEASLIATSFHFSYAGIGSAEAAYSHAASSRTTGRSVYFLYTITGESVRAEQSQIAWPQGALAGIDKISDRNTRLRTFVGRFGSHYAIAIQYGARLAIRAQLNTTDQTEQKTLSAKVNAALGAITAGASFSSEDRKALSDSKIAISAELTAGDVTPSKQSVVLTSLEQVADFLTEFRANRITITPGPISADLLTYSPTLDQASTSKIAADLAVVAPALAPTPYGVPPGTILAWAPRAGDIQKIGTDTKILTPDGWVVCDGKNKTLDLTDRVPMGTAKGEDVGKTDPGTLGPTIISVEASALGPPRDEPGYPGQSPFYGPPVGAPWGKFHRIISTGTVPAITAIPPNTRVIFICRV